ncbi:hypothetical protein [Sphingomonas oryzagri]
MQDSTTDTEHAMQRARDEARLAALANEPAVARAHHGLSILHAERARRLLRGERPIGSAFPQFSQEQADIIEVTALHERLRSV